MFGPRRDPADISHEDLARDERQADGILAWIERARAGVEAVTGTGEAASGQVIAIVAADGKVLDVTIRQRAMRLDSRTLAEEVLAALQQAGLDAARKTEELIREALPGFDPAAATAQLERLAGTPWD
ncbi:YbaB/EbfC family nucleoid-associated protein [Nonomuraea sp. CA-141351]|uniref:YbaB/EbfC family nucleoid-associated protein n=1 Tax=Nonomuraea sp. CA-141351 TaxID=3239996 RepID=UPI003D8CA4CA